MNLTDQLTRECPDPADCRRGVVMARWYFPQGSALPTTRLAPFAAIDQHLPATTARITPTDRQAELNKRRRGLEGRMKF